MGVDTKPNFSSNKFEQCTTDIMNLSGCTQIYGKLDLESGSTLSILNNYGNGKVLTSDENGVATWKLINTSDLMVYYVDANNAVDGDGSVTNPYRTLNLAVDAVIGGGSYANPDNPDVTIFVQGGTYSTAISLAINDTSWSFEEGSVVTYTGSDYLFQGSGMSTASGRNYLSVRGLGQFSTSTGGILNAEGTNNTQGEGTYRNFYFEAKSALSTYSNDADPLDKPLIKVGSPSSGGWNSLTSLLTLSVEGLRSYSQTTLHVFNHASLVVQDTAFTIGHSTYGTTNVGARAIDVDGLYSLDLRRSRVGGYMVDHFIEIGTSGSTLSLNRINVDDLTFNGPGTPSLLPGNLMAITQLLHDTSQSYSPDESRFIFNNIRHIIRNFSNTTKSITYHVMDGYPTINTLELTYIRLPYPLDPNIIPNVRYLNESGNDTYSGGSFNVFGERAYISNLRACSGGENVVLVSSTGELRETPVASISGGIDWAGSTANGIATYVDSSTVCSEPTLTYNGGVLLLSGVTTETKSIEIGCGRSGNGYAYIDLVGDTTYTDYGLRIIRENTGANARSLICHRGTGNLLITTPEAADICLCTPAGTTSVNSFRLSTGAASGCVLVSDGSGNATWTTPTGGGITWAGTTANGIGTYASSGTVCSEPNLTFDGTTLSLTGSMCASSNLCAYNICALGLCICATTVCGGTWVCSSSMCSTFLTVGTFICSARNSTATNGQVCLINASTGDATLLFEAGTPTFTVGIDNSDSDAFKIYCGTALGITDLETGLRIDPTNCITSVGNVVCSTARFTVEGKALSARPAVSFENPYASNDTSITNTVLSLTNCNPNATIRYINFYADTTMVGGIQSGHGTVAITQTSDCRFKKCIEDSKCNSLLIVNSIPVRQYYWCDEKIGTALKTGYIAQEVQEYLPEMIDDGDENHLMVRESMIIPHLHKAIQQQQELIEELKRELNIIKNKI